MLTKALKSAYIKDAKLYLCQIIYLLFIMGKLTKNQELSLVTGGDPQKISAFIAENYFRNPNAEISFIKRGHRQELMSYIKNFCFSDTAEPYFIRQGAHQAIMSYIEAKWLCQDAEVELMKRGNREEILCYVSLHDLGVNGFGILIKRGYTSEILKCLKHKKEIGKPITESQFKMIVEHGNNEVINFAKTCC